MPRQSMYRLPLSAAQNGRPGCAPARPECEPAVCLAASIPAGDRRWCQSAFAAAIRAVGGHSRGGADWADGDAADDRTDYRNHRRCVDGARSRRHRRGDATASPWRGAEPGVIATGGRRIVMATMPVDFRRGMDSLANLVQLSLGASPFCGDIFIFRSKRADRVKILAWDGSGLWVCAKRLERGRFTWPVSDHGQVSLRGEEFSALIHGLEVHTKAGWYRR